jgi:hypothetical protein
VGFYNSNNYERALKFLEWMTNITHTNNNFRNVGMLEIVNEPDTSPDNANSVRTNYYPQAFEVSCDTHRSSKGEKELKHPKPIIY